MILNEIFIYLFILLYFTPWHEQITNQLMCKGQMIPLKQLQTNVITSPLLHRSTFGGVNNFFSQTTEGQTQSVIQNGCLLKSKLGNKGFLVEENIQNIHRQYQTAWEKATNFTLTGVRSESKLSHQTDLNINALRPCLYEMSKSLFFFFFLSYFKYFKPWLVQCLNKLWH